MFRNYSGIYFFSFKCGQILFLVLQGAFIGLICGFVLTLWIGIGAQIYKPLDSRTLPLPLLTTGCNISILSTELPTVTTAISERYMPNLLTST